MCRGVHNIFLCGHDESELIERCAIRQRNPVPQQVRRKGGLIPNHDVPYLDRRVNRVCDRCRQEGRPLNPDYVRAARDEIAGVRTLDAAPSQRPRSVRYGQQPCEYRPGPGGPPRANGLALPGQRPQRPERPQPLRLPVWAGAPPPHVQAGRGGYGGRGMRTGGLPGMFGPNRLVYVMTPRGGAPMNAYL